MDQRSDWTIRPQEVWATGKLKLVFHNTNGAGRFCSLDITDESGVTRRVRFHRSGEVVEVKTLTLGIEKATLRG